MPATLVKPTVRRGMHPDFAPLGQESGERLFGREAPYRLAAEIVDIDVIHEKARRLIAEHEPKSRQPMAGEYEVNARTALFEALTASGHLSRVELDGGYDIDQLHTQIIERLLNGIQLHLPAHELARRRAELIEELAIQEVYQKIIAGELPPDTQLASESTYPIFLSDKVAGENGYRYYNLKGMTRCTGYFWRKDGSIVRITEQISHSNSLPSDAVNRRAAEGIETAAQAEPDVAVLYSPVIYSLKDMSEGVVALQRRIDAFKGDGIMYGEVPSAATASYENLREVSFQREEAIMKPFVEGLAAYQRRLDVLLDLSEIDEQRYLQMYHHEVRDRIRDICVLWPEYTKDALGEAVVGDYQRAHEQMAQGDYGGADATIGNAQGREQAVIICGVGEVYVSSSVAKSDTAQAIEKMRNGDKMFDECMECPECKAKGVFIEKSGGNVDYTCVRGCTTATESTTGDASPTASETDGPSRRENLERTNFRADSIRKKYGDHAAERAVIGIGGVSQVVVDKRTGEVLQPRD